MPKNNLIPADLPDDQDPFLLDPGDDFNLSLEDDTISFLDDEQPVKKPSTVPPREGNYGEPLPVEVDAEEEISEVLQGFQQRAAREDQRYWDAVDSEYWFAVCFQTREQKEEVLRKLNLIEAGDKYIDGYDFARILGIKIESLPPPMPQARPFDREYLRIADDFEE